MIFVLTKILIIKISGCTYVAVTWEKKYLYLSRSETSRDKYVSAFLMEAKDSSYLVKYDGGIPYHADNIPSVKHESIPISLNFSLLEDYFDCPYRFKLSMFYGFAQPLVPALGYQELMGTKADYMEIYQLDSENRARESITDNMIEEVRIDIKGAAANIRRNHLPRKYVKEKCGKCHFNHLCLSKAEKRAFEIG